MSDVTQLDAPSHVHTKGHVLHHAFGYDLLVALLLFGREGAFRRKLLSFAKLKPGEHVLDIGCGTGFMAIVAKQQVGPSGRVSGVDASPEMIARATRKARKKGVDVEFREGVVESLPYPDAHFDVVTSVLMLHHLPRAAREACAREACRVLKPGGRMLAVDFGWSARDKSLIDRIHGRGGLASRDIVELLTGAGMQVLESGAAGVMNLHYALGSSRGA